MRLNHVLLLTTLAGAGAALLLAAEMHSRISEAEAAYSALSRPVESTESGSTAEAFSQVTEAANRQLPHAMGFVLGLVALAFLFLATFMMLLTTQRRAQLAASGNTVAAESSQAGPITESVPPADAIEVFPVDLEK